MVACAVHLILLVYQFDDSGDYPLLIETQEIIALIVLGKDAQQLSQVFRETVEQIGDGVLHQTPSLHLLFDEQQIGTAGILVVGLLPLDAKLFAHLQSVLAYLTAGCLKKGGIHWISYLCIGTGGIHFQKPFVLTALRICEFCRIRVICLRLGRLLAFVLGFLLPLAATFFLQTKLLLKHLRGHGVDFLLADTLANGDEQAWIEDGSVRKLRQTAEVLHVGILTDDVYRLLVRKTEFVLDYHCTDYHTGWLVACASILVGKT